MRREGAEVESVIIWRCRLGGAEVESLIHVGERCRSARCQVARCEGARRLCATCAGAAVEVF